MNITVSKNFKKMTSKAIFSIVIFVFVYMILLSLSVGLTVLCVFGGVTLIITKPMILTIGLGLGLASLGFFIITFLFKFLFKKHEINRGHLVEIFENEEPKLFEFIKEIVDEVQTDFPKKIYLSSEVNASVFYNSSFWSMFFPIKKNLHIGFGLVNTVSEQEFKAILAHEFGHFSQRSMKVGSYVYNVNQVIFNMLYDNDSFENMIQKWANISGYFSVFVIVAMKIIQGIQWVLRKMYEFINLSYMGLSREMEFHADEVAANVAGYMPLKESLLRMELADYSYNSVLLFYDTKVPDAIKSNNIFKEQHIVMNFQAKESQLLFKNGLPVVTDLDINKYNKSKLNIEDQWASHPSTGERIKALEKLKIIKENLNDNPAKTLFTNPLKIEEVLTDKIFSKINYEGNVSFLENEKFEEEYFESIQKNSFHKKYNGYYDNKNPNKFDLEIVDNHVNYTVEELYSKEKIDLVYEHIALVKDKNVIMGISNKKYKIKSFDYNGQKYTIKEANHLIDKLEIDIKNIQDEITENDKNIYNYSYNKAKIVKREDEFKNTYFDCFNTDADFDRKLKLYTDIIEATNFVSVVTRFEDIEINFRTLQKLEKSLKIEINILLENSVLEDEITKEMKDNFVDYLSHDWIYFRNQNYVDDNLNILFTSVNNYQYLISRDYFLMKMNLLKFQSDLMI
ncbi:M48 family metalloprotease [Flavobacterium sp. '19STA2R22 D10 B1']|uniref:M48 family metalloprotease n=1 Tax=Flavobacterium aerium TaxID=3037261 RepID=UPI00278BDEBE|nr:M48 family metalloprotease [Flavobacterium sp. '19STA2R22 D10 B1']